MNTLLWSAVGVMVIMGVLGWHSWLYEGSKRTCRWCGRRQYQHQVYSGLSRGAKFWRDG